MAFRKILNCVWFWLPTGCQWKAIPESEHLCNGSTAHRWYKRLTDECVIELADCAAVTLCAEQGIKKLKSLGIDCTICLAPLGGQGTGSNPTDCGTQGVKSSILVNGKGRPISIDVSPANVHDLKLLQPTLEKLAEEVFQKLTKDAVLVADKGHDFPEARAEGSATRPRATHPGPWHDLPAGTESGAHPTRPNRTGCRLFQVRPPDTQLFESIPSYVPFLRTPGCFLLAMSYLPSRHLQLIALP